MKILTFWESPVITLYYSNILKNWIDKYFPDNICFPALHNTVAQKILRLFHCWQVHHTGNVPGLVTLFSAKLSSITARFKLKYIFFSHYLLTVGQPNWKWDFLPNELNLFQNRLTSLEVDHICLYSEDQFLDLIRSGYSGITPT